MANRVLYSLPAISLFALYLTRYSAALPKSR